jgi:hypothetical protein
MVEHTAKLRSKGDSAQDALKKAAAVWNTLEDEDKDKYEDLSKKDRER